MPKPAPSLWGYGASGGNDHSIDPRSSRNLPRHYVTVPPREWRRMFWEAYSLFYAAYREAAEKLKVGDLSAAFPEGSFLPPLPFRPDFAPG